MSLRIGIIGFGIVGKSVLRFLTENQIHTPLFTSSNIQINIWDARELNAQEQELITQKGALFLPKSQVPLSQFFDENEYLIASPGVDLRSHQSSFHKLISEMDLFYSLWSKPIIGITGTLGKTTVTRMIHALLSLKEPFAMGGNIGTGMLDLLNEQATSNGAVLELSSFQLAYARKAASSITVWSNIYPNHLDWHGTMDDYFEAKANLLAMQNPEGHQIISVDLLNKNRDRLDELKKVFKGHLYIVGDCNFEAIKEWSEVFPQATLISKDFFPLNILPPGSFNINWLLALTAVYAYTKDISWIRDLIAKDSNAYNHLQNQINQTHRLEHFLSAQNIDFYNDSKSTVTQATWAAIEALGKKGNIIVILGGTSKGVDRTQFFHEVARHESVKKVLYLGPESIKLGLNPSYASLEELIHAIVTVAQPGDQVLFSPGGASFDLFANYTDRGEKFKAAIMKAYSEQSN